MYSIVYESMIIDIVQNPTFVKVLPSGHITFTDKVSANGILGSDKKTIYSFESVNRKDVKVVTINEISETEFNRLKNLLNSGKKITANSVELAAAISDAISKLSEICNNKIIEGFSTRLADGKKHHFKLTPEDQINLLNLEGQLLSSSQTFIYHATGEPCKTFTRAEITQILKAYRQHILYHTTYFNVAKQYIKSLVDIDKVKNFTYGTKIYNLVKDKTIKQILKTGGSL